MGVLFRILSRAILIICIGAVPSFGANGPKQGHVSGKISNASGNPLKDAVINIFKISPKNDILPVTDVRSNLYGMFRAANLTPGTYYLRVTRQGFQPTSTEKFEVSPNRTTSLDVILNDLVDYLSNDEDPRNWDLGTVIRSSSDRRMIFRHLPVSMPDESVDTASTFCRNGTMSLASTTSLGGEDFKNRSQTSSNGIETNFAFAEPLSRRSRMIISGQFDFGKSSYWRVRDTIHYRPDQDHDVKLSLGYGRMNLDWPGDVPAETSPANLEESFQRSRLDTIAFGMEGSTRFYNLLAVNYGIDYSRFRSGTVKSFFYPSLEIILSPSAGWRLKTSLTSRRSSDAASIVLSTGEVLNLAEPTLISVVDDKVSMSQVRHSEISVEKTLVPDTAVEVAVYRDDTYGPGIPIMITMITPENQASAVVNLNEDRSRQQGMRVTFKRRMFSNFSGSLSYVYGEAADISRLEDSVSIAGINGNIRKYTGQQFHHSLTGRMDVRIPDTHTSLLATIRWYPGNLLTPIDWFSDSMDIGSKSVNFEIRQILPLRDILWNAGRWEILLDLRNLLNQGEEVVLASDGMLVLNRNPRSLRFGLSLNFR